VEARLYSGRTGTLCSPTRNRVPVTLVDFRLQAAAAVEQALPASYNGFVYVIDGEVRAGVDAVALQQGDVGWLDRPSGSGATVLRLTAGTHGARVLLYAGEPQNEPMIQHGPFVAGSEQDIARLYREYRAGRFTPMSTLAHASAAGR
jgi:quercetin 2,3-dioxygenase